MQTIQKMLNIEKERGDEMIQKTSCSTRNFSSLESIATCSFIHRKEMNAEHKKVFSRDHKASENE